MVDSTWNLTHVDDSDDSDLTDLSSNENDEIDQLALDRHEHSGPAPPQQTNSGTTRKTTRPSTQAATQKSKERNKDKWPKAAVQLRQNSSLSASNIYDLIKDEMIELNPEYQRGIVWNEAKQSNFINSLYHRFHAPEIVFNTTEDPETGRRLRTCMDGKQRLTSICNFFDGKIPLMPYLNAADAPGYARRKFWSKTIGTTRRPLVPPHIMSTLKTTPIACVEYSELSPHLEREIFQRVQHGVPLTPCDRLPAINGPWADLVRDLRNRMNTTEGFEGYLDWGKARGKDFQAIANIVYLIVHGTSPKKAFPSALRIETFLSSTDEQPSGVRRAVINTMDIFCRIASTPDIGDPLTTNVSPLEFVMAAFLIYQGRKLLTDRQLSDAISRMREHGKRRTGDLKLSQPNFKIFWDFILKTLPKLVSQLVAPERNEKPAASTPYKRRESEVDRFKYPNPEAETTRAVGKSTSVARGKRKRPTEDDDDFDGDDDAGWIVEPSATKARVNKKVSQPASIKVGPPPKAVNRQKDSGSKAKTTVKKSKPAQQAITSNPAVKNYPISKVGSAKIDDQVGRPSVRPTQAMAVQASALPRAQSRTILSPPTRSTPAPQVGRSSVPRVAQGQKPVSSRTISHEAGSGAPPNPPMNFWESLAPWSLQPQAQARSQITHDPRRPKPPGSAASSAVVAAGNPGSFSDKVPRRLDISAPSSSRLANTPYVIPHSTNGTMALGKRRVDTTTESVVGQKNAPRALIARTGTTVGPPMAY